MTGVEGLETKEVRHLLNKRKLKVVRVNSPYWTPEKPEWTFLTPKVNMTLLSIRQLAKTKTSYYQLIKKNKQHPDSSIILS
jgi:hypothetical protein